jgi:hypothetical protein
MQAPIANPTVPELRLRATPNVVDRTVPTRANALPQFGSGKRVNGQSASVQSKASQAQLFRYGLPASLFGFRENGMDRTR